MIISIVNHTNGKVTDEELQTAIRAINRQIAEDFTPYWSLAATLRLEGRSASQPDSAQAADMRGDAVIYLWDKSDVEGALGYHFQNNRGIPFGFVFTSIAEELGEPWSITLSHEALELIGDAETNQLAIGPHPDPAQDRSVFFWFEMCDAVEAESYEIDGVKVSNFLLPLYFTGTRDNDEPGARNDYLGRAYKGQTLRSFGINPGGYVGFFDPQTGKNETYSLRADAAAKQRYETKCEVREAYRGYRYATPEAREKLQRKGTGRRAGTTSLRMAQVCALMKIRPSRLRRDPIGVPSSRVARTYQRPSQKWRLTALRILSASLRYRRATATSPDGRSSSSAAQSSRMPIRKCASHTLSERPRAPIADRPSFQSPAPMRGTPRGDSRLQNESIARRQCS